MAELDSDHRFIPPIGVSKNDDSDYDYEYVEKLTRERKDYRPFYNSRLPLAEIKKALETKESRYEPGDERYLWERKRDVAVCPICSEFQTWNRQVLLEHVQKHDEVVGFLKGHDAALRQHESLLERREKIKVGIQQMNEELQAIENKIVKLEKDGKIAANQKQYDALFRLLYGSLGDS